MKVWSMKIMKYKAYIDSICVNFTEQQYKNYGIIHFSSFYTLIIGLWLFPRYFHIILLSALL